MPSTRAFTPRGLGNRSALILFVPILVILFGMTWYYYDYHIRQVDRNLTSHVARDMALFLEAHSADSAQTMTLKADLERLHEIHIDLTETCDLADYDPVDGNRFRIRENIGDVITAPYVYRTDASTGLIRFCVMTGERENVVFEVLRKRMIVINSHIFIVWVTLLGLLMAALAYGFLRNQVRSILRLAAAAKAFGRGRDVPNFKPAGAAEVREAARAVIDMKHRLTSFAEQRTTMLAGVSHDLRTPLTRLKLQFAMMDQTEDVKALRQDITDMEAMLDEYLAFARGEDAEPPTELRIDKIIANVAHALNNPGLTLEQLEPVSVTGRTIALKRAITNLVQNALDHAEHVSISINDGPRWVDILVDDDGPGIEPQAREEAVKPFSRLDEARTQNRAGAGLGLAIAHDAAHAHGGELRLETSPQGGLRARLRLPH